MFKSRRRTIALLPFLVITASSHASSCNNNEELELRADCAEDQISTANDAEAMCDKSCKEKYPNNPDEYGTCDGDFMKNGARCQLLCIQCMCSSDGGGGGGTIYGPPTSTPEIWGSPWAQ